MRKALAGLGGLAIIESALIFSGAQAATAPPPPTISVLPVCGPVGAALTITGSNFQPGPSGNPVTVSFDPGGSPSSTVQVPGKLIDASGGFTAKLTVPSRALRAAPYQVVATQPFAGGGIAGGQLKATANFSLSCLTLTVDPNCGLVGRPVTVRGTGWRPDISVSIAFTPPAGGKPDATVAPGQDTTFAINVVVPSRPPGNYVVVATQVAPPSAVALPPTTLRAEFLIPCVRAAIVLRPNVGPPGTLTTVTGIGFPVGAVVKLTWSQGIPLSSPSITIGSSGGFQVTVLIYPHDQLGLRHLRAGPDLTVTGAPLFNIAMADFLVVPGSAQPHDFSWRH